ncbi:hypothetical protein BDZ89DRAFT_1104406 [Hymenopellis radicata]|nr:hypothetical protein BDZ89DRAFT_1104406 [Hymenopellis radicata]
MQIRLPSLTGLPFIFKAASLREMEANTNSLVSLGHMAHPRASQRWYNPAPGVKYILPSDETERERLDFQHRFLTRKLCDGYLIFAPNAALKKDLQVLDSATGTAPGANFIGIDIQDRLFPAVTLENASFSVHSVFDLVNQRLLMAALGEEQWKIALHEVHRVLVPGGYVQFVEGSRLDNMGPASEACHKVFSKLLGARNLNSNIAELLPAMLRDAGFRNVWSETRSFPLGKWGGEDGLIHADLIIRAFSALRGPVLSLGLVANEAEYDALLEPVRKEWDEFPGTGLRWMKAYACK